MAKRVFVTGLGIITSIGKNLEENLVSLTEGNSGIGEIQGLDTIFRGKLPAGEIRMDDAELAKMLGIDLREGMTRTALLGMIAVEEAMKGAGFLKVPGSPFAVRNMNQRAHIDLERGTGNGEPRTICRIGLISGSTVGGMVATEKHYLEFLEQESYNPWIEANEGSDTAEQIARYTGISDFVCSINTACSSSANAIMTGARMIRAGQLDRVVAGGADALSLFTLNGFNTLMIYDKDICKPFDHKRNGLNLGEGAAFLVLEAEDALGGRQPLCEVTGWGNSTDAFHQTALSPEGEGPYLAMKLALERSGLAPGEISYINAHGTATQNNDLSEGNAMTRLFGDKLPPFSSTKANTGHLLGASGAVEAVFSVLSIRHDLAWPSLNFSIPMEEQPILPVRELLRGRGIRHVLSNSFGFGGNNTSLVFSAT